MCSFLLFFGFSCAESKLDLYFHILQDFDICLWNQPFRLFFDLLILLRHSLEMHLFRIPVFLSYALFNLMFVCYCCCVFDCTLMRLFCFLVLVGAVTFRSAPLCCIVLRMFLVLMSVQTWFFLAVDCLVMLSIQLICVLLLFVMSFFLLCCVCVRRAVVFLFCFCFFLLFYAVCVRAYCLFVFEFFE